MKKTRLRLAQSKQSGGSAIIAVLSLIGLLTILLVCLLQSVRIERSSSAASSAEEQAQLSAESGIASAEELFLIATSNRPAYLVGLPLAKDHAQEHEEQQHEEITPPLLLGASNLISSNQILPLFSFDLKQAASFPKLTNGTLESLLEERSSSNPAVAVDLNDPSLVGTSLDTNSAKATNQPTPRSPGMIAAEGSYPALWQSLHDSEGKVIGR